MNMQTIFAYDLLGLWGPYERVRAARAIGKLVTFICGLGHYGGLGGGLSPCKLRDFPLFDSRFNP